MKNFNIIADLNLVEKIQLFYFSLSIGDFFKLFRNYKKSRILENRVINFTYYSRL